MKAGNLHEWPGPSVLLSCPTALPASAVPPTMLTGMAGEKVAEVGKNLFFFPYFLSVPGKLPVVQPEQKKLCRLSLVSVCTRSPLPLHLSRIHISEPTRPKR